MAISLLVCTLWYVDPLSPHDPRNGARAHVSRRVASRPRLTPRPSTVRSSSRPAPWSGIGPDIADPRPSPSCYRLREQEVGMGIVNTLRRARRRSGASLRSVASLSGVGAGNLSAIENGHREPTSSTVDRLASTMGIEWVPFHAEGRTPAASAADEITRAENDGRHAQAYRRFLQLADDLASADPVTRVLLSAEPPDTPPLAGWTRSPLSWNCVCTRFALRSLHGSPATPVSRMPCGSLSAVHALSRSAQITTTSREFLKRGVAIEQGELLTA